MRHILAAAALLAFSGCQTGAFSGLTRVPPPGTGSVSASQPYYQPAAERADLAPPAGSPLVAAETVPSLAAGAAPSLAPSAATSPALNSGQEASEDLTWSRPGAMPVIPNELDQPGSGLRQTVATTPAVPAAVPPAVPAVAPLAPVAPAQAASPTRATVPPPATGTVSGAVPGTFQSAGQVRPIASQGSGYADETGGALPLRGFDSGRSGEAVGTGVAAQPQVDPASTQVAASTWTTPDNTPDTSTAAVAPEGSEHTVDVTAGGTVATVSTPVDRYGYQPDYSQLSGRLEFEQATSRWKLRYIPHDAPNNQIDQFGGSVVLANSGQLPGLRAGDFVRVTGQLGDDDSGSADFAPSYYVAQVSSVQ